jgi:hypothetical protein
MATEVWLRGPLPDHPPLLQPVAHSLLQSREEVGALLPGVSTAELWLRPAVAAAAGYHVLHAAGSIDRLFAYARGEALTDAQREALAKEAAANRGDAAPEADDLLALFDARIDAALAQLRATPESSLLDRREVGRAKLPSTVLGLLFHTAEHTQRHVGQFVTTLRFVRARASGSS